MAQNSISSELNDLLITHDFDVDALSTKTGKPAVNERGVPDVSKADMFSFDWVGPTGKNYGTMVILLDQNGGMTVYFGDNLGRTMDPEDKKAWYGDEETNSTGFLEQLKNFAIRTSKIRGGFGLENLSKLKYAIAGQAALTESFYGTKKVSYSGQPTEARLMIKHTRSIAEGDKRYRYVESLFIETAEGERFRLPFRKLAGGRAMLEHVRHGGNPYDLRGQHIAETVNQLNVLSQFRRAHQGRVFEGAAGELVTETDQYYQRLNHNLKHMASSRGYNRYFESWKPADISEGDIMVEDLRGMFVETRIDPRIETALPMLAKIQQEVKAMKEADIFESWAARLVEGTWALPDTPEKMTQLKTWLGEPKPLGPDAEDVTDVLYDLIGDVALFDQLAGMASEDPTADAVPLVQAWITRNKDQSPELSELAMSFETTAPAAPAAPPAPAAAAPPAAPAPAAQPVAEGEDDLVDLEPHIKGLKSQFNKFMKHGERMERDPAYAHKINKHYAKITKGNHSDHGLDPDPEVDEGDNLQTFEDIVRLSGAPIKESRVEESSEYLYEKIGKILAQQHPMLNPNSDEFAHAVYHEMIELGMTPRSAKHKISYDEDFLSDVATSFHHYVGHGELDEAGVQVQKVRTPNMVQAQGVPNPDIASWKFNDEPLPHTELDSFPMPQGPDMTSGEPFADEVGYDGKWIPRIHMSGVGKTHDDEETLDECNYTALNEYCPKHGLEECGTMGMFESELARIKSLSSFK